MSFFHLNPNRPEEALARQLERCRDYRVLRRLPAPEDMWCRTMPVPSNVFTLAVLDCETTGLDPQADKIIELSIGTLSIDLDAGDVVGVTPPVSWLEDPGHALSPEIEQLTHITSDMLQGQAISDHDVDHALRGVHAIVCHNAKFDYSFVSRRFPDMAFLPWLCSIAEIDWAELGFTQGRSIAGLLTHAGFFLPEAHRAAADVWATICLLSLSGGEGRCMAARLVDKARRDTYRLYAVGAPFSVKDVLKAAGYRWSPEFTAWWIEGDEERISNEKLWLRQLHPSISPARDRVTWLDRHRS